MVKDPGCSAWILFFGYAPYLLFEEKSRYGSGYSRLHVRFGPSSQRIETPSSYCVCSLSVASLLSFIHPVLYYLQL